VWLTWEAGTMIAFAFTFAFTFASTFAFRFAIAFVTSSSSAGSRTHAPQDGDWPTGRKRNVESRRCAELLHQ
jgi:hypothetical protein